MTEAVEKSQKRQGEREQEKQGKEVASSSRLAV
jgi:hypothetical protein